MAWIPENVRQLTCTVETTHTLIERKQIINHNACQQHAQLPNLPQEIILEVTKYLGWPDNVSLSLTCKGLAKTTQFAREHFATVKAACDVKNAAGVAGPLRGNANCSSQAMPKSHARPVRKNAKVAHNVSGSLNACTKFDQLDLLRQISDFFPATRYTLCYKCIKYVPSDLGCVAWGGDKYKSRKFHSGIAHVLGPRCERCVDDVRMKVAQCGRKSSG